MTRSRNSGPAQQRDGQSWYRIQAQAGGPAQVMLYDLIGTWGVTAKDFLADLAAVGDGPVDVHIASDGGDVFEAYAIYTALASRPGVVTYVDSLAASSASVIAMAGGQRYMARLSQLMIHDAWAGVDGNADDLQHMIGRLNTVSEQIAQVYADTAGGDVSHWRALMKAETWFTPQQALDAGLITGITAAAREPATTPAARMAAAGITAADAAGMVMNATGSNAGWVQRDGEWEYDPDGDGDDDSSADTDTDHSHWSADGTQLQPVPPNPATGKGGKPLAPGNQAGPGPQGASVDNSPWDAARAWANGAASDAPATFYRGICAGEHTTGDPGTQAHWALPYRYTPEAAPNAAGVRNALSRLPQTADLKDPAGVKAKLERLMKQVNPDWEPGNSAAGASAANRRETTMPAESDALTIEGRRTRITEINARLQEVAAAHPSSELPAVLDAEWLALVDERSGHQAALDAVERRSADIAAGLDPAGNGNRFDRPLGSDGRPLGGQPPPASGQRGGAPAFHPQRDIYDLGAIRQQARSPEDLPGLYRQYALRAIEAARFPGSSREDVQGRVAKLLDTVTDDENGWLPRRILATGSPDYKRVFGRALKAGNPGAVSGRDGQILALGESDGSGGGYAVPFELDPTVILTSDGAINPLRAMARVERITGKEYDLVTSAGVVVSRQAEFAEVNTAAVTLTQPTVKPNRVNGFIPFSVELEGDWTALQAEMMRLLADAKDVEEATGTGGFVLGNGTAPVASGIIATLGTASVVHTAGTAAFTITDVYATKNATPPRWRSRGQWLAQSAIYDLVRQMGTGSYANVWAESLAVGTPARLAGYPAGEESAMAGTLTSGSKIMLFGDFNQFLIVDRVGMNMELVPHVMGTANNYPSGTRGYYAWWRNNSLILVQNAFRLLQTL